jgi:hypothetical protein
MSLPDPIREIPVTNTFIPIAISTITLPVWDYSCKKKCCKRYKKGKKRCKKCPEKN